MPTMSSTHSSGCGSAVKPKPTTIAAAAAQISDQRQPCTGAPSRRDEQARLEDRGEAERQRQADRRAGRLKGLALIASAGHCSASSRG